MSIEEHPVSIEKQVAADEELSRKNRDVELEFFLNSNFEFIPKDLVVGVLADLKTHKDQVDNDRLSPAIDLIEEVGIFLSKIPGREAKDLRDVLIKYLNSIPTNEF
ncbi:MAG TPA: hypothetical protein PLZ58_02465 [Candidatus Saccharibacteria bacterium]|nr:hypothetical protein [Candidatus Saccharibacteria bacterium]HRQ06640.1 hypothetical protein [Candidatus Saccharibacteria bacterium]